MPRPFDPEPAPLPSSPCHRPSPPPLPSPLLPDPLTQPPSLADLVPSPTPRERHRLAVSAIGHSGNQRNHGGPGLFLREAVELLSFEVAPSNDPAALRQRAAALRAATARALALEAAAAELADAEYDAAVVRRRLERTERSYRRRSDLETRRAAGGLYAGQPRSPNRPTHVEVDDRAWATLKRKAARQGRAVGEVVGDLVASAADGGIPPERTSERWSERPAGGGRRAARYARLFLPDDDTWSRFRARAVDASVSIARAVGLVVEDEARRRGWRPEAGR